MGRYGFNPLTRLSVNRQLLLLLLVMVIPILVLQVFGSAKAEDIMKRNVTSAYAELNKQNLSLISRDTDTVSKITSTVIGNPITQQLRTDADAASSEVIERVRRFTAVDKLLSNYSTEADGTDPISYAFYVYDPNDVYAFAPKRQMSSTGVYFFDKDSKPIWYDEAVARKGNGYMKVMNSMVETSAGKKTLAYIRAVRDTSAGTGVIGVLVATNMEEKIGASLKSVDLPEGGNLFFTDATGVILASSEMSRMGTLLEMPQDVAKQYGSGKVSHVIAGDVIYVATNNGVGQKLVYQIPTKSLMQQQTEIKRVISVLSIAYLLLCCIVMTYFWRSLMKPLQKMASFSRTYEPGKLVPGTPGKDRRDEVGILMTSLYDMARRLNMLIHDKYQMEIKQKETQLQMLYQQINPHLLYNTLESIYWKSTIEGRSESAEMIKDLSKLMRISLSRGRELITIGEELEHASAYIKLQQHRYAFSFTVVWEVPEDALVYLIPKITLQPLIENGIIHGIKHMGEDGEIAIRVHIEAEKITIRVEDNGYKETDCEAIERILSGTASDEQSGYGIRNIQQRIQLHFGPRYGLGYRPREGGGTVAIITLPMVTVPPREAEQELD
ncbi:integral membrane sensor signal transduction histidine kinase [Paenibacillus curdlanolyticus YK9]|uniref:Integral membrane sensor signal transduction histidine kinase n=1 Tax=Paenibacillus curdlanolyticus YK9 TaxID=717606 RepID=E0I7P8_9BACL|nr:sensor histidine kinase [Paenibacillus curdlanolyticus]EFM11203.1 integral membrane sensor signal transduction histidine kinase [Paenibacillus curdlanolyticus YK9]